MKKIIAAISLIFLYFYSNAQSVAINNDGSTANASSILDVKSTTKGILIPRMNKAEKNAFAAPAAGLLVFQTAPDSIGFYYYNAGSWIWLQNSSGGWSTTGNTGTDTSVNFIGTKDDKAIGFRINNQKAGYIGSIADATTSLGQQSLLNNTSGHSNTGFGTYTLTNNKTGNYNAAVGVTALYNNLFGDNNTAIGAFSLANNRRGNGAIAIGYQAAYNDTIAEGNVAIGRAALFYNNGKSGNVAIGDSSLFRNNYGTIFPLQSVDNVAVGNHSLFSNTNGFKNTAIGSEALYSNIGGYYNLANGFKALNRNTDGYANTAAGAFALVNNTLGNNNVALGSSSLEQNTNGSNNTAIGTYNLDNNISGSGNSGIGFRALRLNSTGSNNSALGDSSLYSNVSGFSNVALGTKALRSNISQSNLVAIGDSAMYNNGLGANSTQAIRNTAIGSKALYSNTIGYENTAVGYNALKVNIGGFGNTSFGSGSLSSNLYGSYNVGIGRIALSLCEGNENVAVGNWALNRLTSGNNNTAIGNNAGNGVEGSNNTFISADSRNTPFNRNISGTVFLGFEAGNNEITSNKLYIENSNANKDNALIYGDFAGDSLNLNAKVNVRDFTRLGTQASGAPAIKMKKIVIASGPAVDAIANYPFGGGITDSKILGVDVLMRYDAGTSKIPPGYRDAAGYEYNIQVQFNGISVINKAGNSANIGGKPITILITYEE